MSDYPDTLVATWGTQTKTYAMPPVQPVVPHRYAMVKHHPRPFTELLPGPAPRYSLQGAFIQNGMVFYPDTVPMQNTPAKTTKGDPIRIFDGIWNHIRAINSDRGYSYTRSVGAMWINLHYVEGEIPRAECIHCGGNFVEIERWENGHALLKSYLNTDTTIPDTDTWFNKPELHWKACAIDINGKVINVNNALDVYFPLVCATGSELWMYWDDLEEFAEIPPVGLNVGILETGMTATIYDYRLEGASVYGVTQYGEIPLLLARVPGEYKFPTTWMLQQTIGVIPPP
jgi:hypothetical protein